MLEKEVPNPIPSFVYAITKDDVVKVEVPSRLIYALHDEAARSGVSIPGIAGKAVDKYGQNANAIEKYLAELE